MNPLLSTTANVHIYAPVAAVKNINITEKVREGARNSSRK